MLIAVCCHPCPHAHESSCRTKGQRSFRAVHNEGHGQMFFGVCLSFSQGDSAELRRYLGEKAIHERTFCGMQVAQADEEFIVKEKKKAEEAYRQKVTTLFRQVDTSGDGKIDVHEFKRLLKALHACWDSTKNRMQWYAAAFV